MVTTSVLIRNLHCPSCVTTIEESLQSLSSQPNLTISASIVSQTVTIRHDSTLSSADITGALEKSGFDLEKVTRSQEDGFDEETIVSSSRSSTSKGNRKRDASQEPQRHIDNCDMCRGEIEAPKNGDFTGVHVESEPGADSLAKATLSLSGMTCSSCVSIISETLSTMSWVESIYVNLINNSAEVTFHNPKRVSEVVETIEDLGYGADVTSCVMLDGDASSAISPKLWRGSFAIDGMTCSSCVVTISDALKPLDWVEDFNVNLIMSSASVVVKEKGRLNEVIGIIENLGYDAKLNDVEPTKSSDETENQERKVIIQVDGMHCEHCPSRVLDMLNNLYGGRVHVEKPLSLSDPRVKIRYVPQPPEFNIRRLLKSIRYIDPHLTPSIYHPPSLEERSIKINRRHRNHIAKKLILSFVAAIPTFIIGVVFMSLVPSSDAWRRYFMEPVFYGRSKRADWVLFIISTPVYFFAADFFHRRALTELWTLWKPGSRTPLARRFYRFGSMDLLLSLGVTIAYFSSIAVLAIDASKAPGGKEAQSEGTYFDAVVFLTMFLLVGRLLEAYSKAKAGDALGMLGKLRPNTASLVDPSGETMAIPVDHLDYGDIVRVAHGNSPPFDGTVTEGRSQFDESSLTGESRLVPKHVADEVFSGTINKGGPILIRISRVSGNSILDQIIAAVREGQTRRAPVERVADVLTGFFVPVVTYLAVAVWIVWLTLGLSGALPDDYLDVDAGGWPFWSLKFAVAVFVIACPCGIGLAAPTALFVGGGLAAKHGILVKGGGEAFQEASHLDCIVFDKTGTLTQGGEPAITGHSIFLTEDRTEIVSAVKKLEESSSHPLAKAMVSFCQTEEVREVQATVIEEIAGMGMKGSFSISGPSTRSLDIIIGNEPLMTLHDVAVEQDQIELLDGWKSQGNSVVLIAFRWQSSESTGWRLWAMLSASDPLRPEASQVVKAFQNRGIDTWMISGDNPKTALAVAEKVGIPSANVIAGVLPEQKSEQVRYLQQTLHKTRMRRGWLGGKKRVEEDLSKRATIAMVGDGINDSPALTVADVGIAIGSGSDIAISSAEFVLVSSDLTALLGLVDLSRMVFTRIKFNFGWALVYNLIALPVAAGVLYPLQRNGQHVRLDPVWASLAMALSSISVVCSSLLMRTEIPLLGFRRKA